MEWIKLADKQPKKDDWCWVVLDDGQLVSAKFMYGKFQLLHLLSHEKHKTAKYWLPSDTENHWLAKIPD